MLSVYALFLERVHFFSSLRIECKKTEVENLKNLRSHIPAKGEADQSATELTKKIAAAYDGQSSAGIWMQILAEAEKSKKEGKLTNAEIDEFYTQFSPMLDAGQRKQLKAVVERLKKI